MNKTVVKDEEFVDGILETLLFLLRKEFADRTAFAGAVFSLEKLVEERREKRENS